MVKHTQTIRRQIAYELFDCVWPFCEIGAKRVSFHLLRSGEHFFGFYFRK